MKGNDIRQAYLSFFESKGHLKLDSFPLIPKDDPSLLLIGAGMAPLKPFFTGKVEPPRHRVTTCQKCIRTGDIENVGHTARHHTFFEMLGNFSFGDYFKKEAISWAWEFLTEVLHMEPEKLYVTVYPKDQEAYDYWHKMIGIPEERIYRLEDNFWEIGEGPCGPDSEIFYDQGESFGTGPENQMGGDGDRFLEIWNLVFSQFDRQKDGSYLPLAKKNIDTGAGLERLAAVLQKKKNNFETDLFFPIIERAENLSGISYGSSAQNDVALKVISDHARAVTNLIADGILPSNEGRGYVLRRILRRAVRFGRLLGIQQAFMGQMTDEVIHMMAPAYPDLSEKQDYIKKVISTEEKRFQSTLRAGSDLLSDIIEQARSAKENVLTGDSVFKLYDTYGFPWELTEEIAKENSMDIDRRGFKAAMEEQRDRARKARARASLKVATPDTTGISSDTLTEEDSDGDTRILLLGENGKPVKEAADGSEVTVILQNTPFHAEGGGQVGDTGHLIGPAGVLDVRDAYHLPDGIPYLAGTVREGVIASGDKVHAEVDRARRHALAQNHTATHLLQAALRKILGAQVTQAGSLVLPDRLRFDFTWPEPVSQKQLDSVEKLVNEKIWQGLPVQIDEMTLEEAKKIKAMALFGEKYGHRVRVVRAGDFSIELCGGSHVGNTGEIGIFRILGEGGIGSGVRRIEAMTGQSAYDRMKNEQHILTRAGALLKTDPVELEEKISKLIALSNEQARDIDQMKRKAAGDQIEEILKMACEKNGISYFAASVTADTMDELRKTADLVKNRLSSYAFLLGTAVNGKVYLVAMASPDAVKKGAHMGQLISAAASLCGGGGGGRPDMAQAGGHRAEKLEEALHTGAERIAEMLG